MNLLKERVRMETHFAVKTMAATGDDNENNGGGPSD